MSAYDTDIHEQNGRRYRVEFHVDDAMRAPWKEQDFGVVSEWTSREKAPGERVLNEDHGQFRYYDVAATTELARKDGWVGEGGRREGETVRQCVARRRRQLRVSTSLVQRRLALRRRRSDVAGRRRRRDEARGVAVGRRDVEGLPPRSNPAARRPDRARAARARNPAHSRRPGSRRQLAERRDSIPAAPRGAVARRRPDRRAAQGRYDRDRPQGRRSRSHLRACRQDVGRHQGEDEDDHEVVNQWEGTRLGPGRGSTWKADTTQRRWRP